ncbi:sulfotransferase family 2 domain-containing protein [Vibrio sp. WJH972]
MLNNIYYLLPYDFRRFLFSKLKAKRFRKWQLKRTIITNTGYSLKPFDQNKCIFVHIPKAAGVSVCRGLFHNLAGGHSNIEQYQVVFSKQEFDDYFKFTFVRNPWDRLFSAYNFLKNEGMNDSDRDWALDNISEYSCFNDFVKGWLTDSNIYSSIHFIPQYKFLCLPNSDEINVDFLGFFENIQGDFDVIADQLKLNHKPLLKHENKTKSSSQKVDYRDFYTDETRKIVAEVYKKDIEIFGYNFDNSSLKNQLKKRSTLEGYD